MPRRRKGKVKGRAMTVQEALRYNKPTVFPRNIAELGRNIRDLPQSIAVLFGAIPRYGGKREQLVPPVQAAQPELYGEFRRRRRQLEGFRR